jgi:hypothetical protein
VVESPPGQANARTVQITLPAGLSALVHDAQPRLPGGRLRPGRVRGANAQIGSAKAETPALAAPLAGPVVLVKPAASPLPELVIDLPRADRAAPAGERRLRRGRATAVDARRPARHRR